MTDLTAIFSLPPERLWDLVIFDCDGVLVDSEPTSLRVLRDLLAEIGLTLSQEETQAQFVGRSWTSCLAYIQQALGAPVPDGFADLHQARLFEALAEEVEPVPGIVEVLDRLIAPFCVASSGEVAKMRLTLGCTGLLPRLEGRLFSATEVARGKPYPDLFLHAAHTLGATPARCAVVEDSVVGVEAGRAAGMTVFGYAARTDAARLADAGAHVFVYMQDLPCLLQSPC